MLTMHFHAGNLIPFKSSQTLGKNKRGRRNNNDWEGEFLRDFPKTFVMGSITQSVHVGSCSKSHVCRICRAKHIAIGCPERKVDKKENQ